MASSKKTVEWLTDTIITTDATVTNGEFDLNLLPKEIARIIAIDSTIEINNVPDAANDELDLCMLLSMDPDADDDPCVAANLEDLEVFFHHWWSAQQEVGAAGTATLLKTSKKHIVFPEGLGILVGTNFSQVFRADTSIQCTAITTVYFQRMKASDAQLTQILLKRR